MGPITKGKLGYNYSLICTPLALITRTYYGNAIEGELANLSEASKFD